jgi:hypothetical protein
MRSVSLGLLCIAFALPAWARTVGEFASPDGALRIRLEAEPLGEPGGIRRNRLSTLIATISAKGSVEARELEFDATMPQHGHGMTTRAASKRVGRNRFRIQGVKLHMAGTWQLSFKARLSDRREISFTAPFELP